MNNMLWLSMREALPATNGYYLISHRYTRNADLRGYDWMYMTTETPPAANPYLHFHPRRYENVTVVSAALSRLYKGYK